MQPLPPFATNGAPKEFPISSLADRIRISFTLLFAGLPLHHHLFDLIENLSQSLRLAAWAWWMPSNQRHCHQVSPHDT